MKISVETRLLENFSSMAASNLLDFLKSGVADFHILSIFGLMLRPQCGALVWSQFIMGILVLVLSLEVGLEYSLIPM